MVKADEIPVANTPPGGWRGDMPPPVLAGCTEPLHPDAPDLRGLWQVGRVERDGQVLTDHRLNEHVERIEQCGDRVVVTSEGVIHDMRADGTLENGVNDVAGPGSHSAHPRGRRLQRRTPGPSPLRGSGGQAAAGNARDRGWHDGLALRPVQGDDATSGQRVRNHRGGKGKAGLWKY